jgi:hypothetical protein
MKVEIMAKGGFKAVELNRRKAIHEKCLDCTCWIPKEVKDCIFSECPLYLFRTGKGKQNPKKRKESIRKYCLWCMAGKSSEVQKCVSHSCALFPYRLKQIDKSLEINSYPENAHIGTISENKTEQGISQYMD